MLPFFFLNADYTFFYDLLFIEISFLHTHTHTYCSVHMMLWNWRRSALENLMAELCSTCSVRQLIAMRHFKLSDVNVRYMQGVEWKLHAT